MRQSFVLYLGRKLPGKNAEQIAVEVSLACESETMGTTEQMEFMGGLQQKVAALVKEAFGGEEMRPPRSQEGG